MSEEIIWNFWASTKAYFIEPFKRFVAAFPIWLSLRCNFLILNSIAYHYQLPQDQTTEFGVFISQIETGENFRFQAHHFYFLIQYSSQVFHIYNPHTCFVHTIIIHYFKCWGSILIFLFDLILIGYHKNRINNRSVMLSTLHVLCYKIFEQIFRKGFYTIWVLTGFQQHYRWVSWKDERNKIIWKKGALCTHFLTSTHVSYLL